MRNPTSPDFNHSQLDFFKLIDSRPVLVLACDSVNIIINGVHCWVKAIILFYWKQWLRSSSLTALHCMMCECSDLVEDKMSLATSLRAVNICWDTVARYLIHCVRRISMQAEITSQNWLGIRYHGNMMNVECVHIRWLDALVMFDAYRCFFCKWRIVCLRPRDILTCFCVLVSKVAHNTYVKRCNFRISSFAT